MDVETAETQFGARWGDWTLEQQASFVAALEPGDQLGLPLLVTLCCAHVEHVPEFVFERIPGLRALKGED